MAETYTPDNLIAGETRTVCDIVTIASGGTALKRGAVLGKITTGGKYMLSASAAADGSETANVILAEDCDPSAADVTNVAVYVKGEFNANALSFGTGHTAASVKAPLRDAGIYIKTSITA